MKSLPPGFVSRVVAVVLAGTLVILLQDDLAERLASPPDLAVLVVDSAEVATVARRAEREERSQVKAHDSGGVAREAAAPAVEEVESGRAPETKTTPPSARPRASAPSKPATSTPSAVVAVIPAPESPEPSGKAGVDTDPASRSGAEPTATVMAAAGCRRITELYEAGEASAARREAVDVLETFGTHSDVTTALVEEGVPAHRARLWTILALHASGDEDEAREQARLARASHPDNQEIAESLRRWSILRPRIVEISSFLNEQQTLVMRGTVRNDDIAAIRKVKVRGEALDDSGNVIAAIDTRVKPRLIASDLAGEFKILFKKLADHERIKRTRATVIQFEYEVAANR